MDDYSHYTNDRLLDEITRVEKEIKRCKAEIERQENNPLVTDWYMDMYRKSLTKLEKQIVQIYAELESRMQ